MRQLVDEAGLNGAIEVDSAGSSAEHLGDGPDRRTTAEATGRGIDLRDLRARQVTARDWEDFDLILVADDMVEQVLRRTGPANPELTGKLHAMTAFGPDAATEPEVPDPYYGGADGFTYVFDLLERSCAGLLDHIRTEMLPRRAAG
jgi:protein-tyrosine phosphatase